MLVLSRKCNTTICIGSDITIRVLGIHKRQVKLGIEAPRKLPVLREELQRVADRGKPRVTEQSFRRWRPCFAQSHRQHS
jgi:carbon storage regulator